MELSAPLFEGCPKAQEAEAFVVNLEKQDLAPYTALIFVRQPILPVWFC